MHSLQPCPHTASQTLTQSPESILECSGPCKPGIKAQITKQAAQLSITGDDSQPLSLQTHHSGSAYRSKQEKQGVETWSSVWQLHGTSGSCAFRRVLTGVGSPAGILLQWRLHSCGCLHSDLPVLDPRQGTASPLGKASWHQQHEALLAPSLVTTRWHSG